MAEADLKMDISSKTQKKPRRFARLALMLSVPLLLIAGGVGYYIANDHYVSTDNAYVQQDKISISAEVGGRIVEVAEKAKPRKVWAILNNSFGFGGTNASLVMKQV